jgi:hypothetical protein
MKKILYSMKKEGWSYQFLLGSVFSSVAMVAIPNESNAAGVSVLTSAYADGNISVSSEKTAGLNSIGTQIDQKQLSSDSAIGTSSEANWNGRSAAVTTASAGFGVLKVAGENSAAAIEGVHVNASSWSIASWGDLVTISSQSSTGLAYVTANLFLDGNSNNLSIGHDDLGYANASARFDLEINSGSVYKVTASTFVASNPEYSIRTEDWNIYSDGNVVNSGLDTIFRLYTVTFPIRLGTAFSMFARLEGSAESRAKFTFEPKEGVAFAGYDLGHSLYWAGISELRDADGNLITDFSLVSDSGTDYRQSFVPVSAVPVPAAVWLFGSGLVGLLGFNRKRSQSLAA